MISLQEIVKEMILYMKRNHLNQTGFARCMKVSVSSISLWLREKRRPNTEHYLKFNELLQEEEKNGIRRTGIDV